MKKLEETLGRAIRNGALICTFALASGIAHAHGDVVPQAVDTSRHRARAARPL